MADIDKKIIKHFKRFLKEHGIFSRVCWLLMNDYKSKRKKPLEETFLRRTEYPENWFQRISTFCYWQVTPEGEKFWWEISICWQYSCYEFYKKENQFNKISKTEIIESIKLYERYYGETENTINIKKIIQNEK